MTQQVSLVLNEKQALCITNSVALGISILMRDKDLIQEAVELFLDGAAIWSDPTTRQEMINLLCNLANWGESLHDKVN